MADPDCPARVTLSLMAAPLDPQGRPDGLRQAVLGDPGVPGAHGGVSEARVLRGPDRRFYLFFSSLPGAGAEIAQVIGLGVADDAFGPFAIWPDPIITADDISGVWGNGGVLAPDVMIENDRVRLWFHAFELDAGQQIVKARNGYVEHPWPILPAS